MMTSDFELKPLKLGLYEGTEADWARVAEPPKMRNQRNPLSYKVKNIKSDRELYKDATYTPDFTNVPIELADVEVELSAEEMGILSEFSKTGKYGDTDADVLRYVFFTWWIDEFMHGPKHVPKV